MNIVINKIKLSNVFTTLLVLNVHQYTMRSITRGLKLLIKDKREKRWEINKLYR